ncbi:YlcG family protein [Lelliottia wanjuensis]|nr:YlcG family protein [Lelliottia sp. V106_16]MDK9356741.1 YlcG family protein [Lelliottia sp. V106_16]
MIIDHLIITSLREEWRALRRFRLPGSLLVDYRILRNYAARLLKEKK